MDEQETVLSESVISSEEDELKQKHTMRFYPDPALRQKSRKVTIFGEHLLDFSKGLAAAMLQQGGIGISAPQVGVYQRIIMVNLTGRQEDNVVLVNPSIKEESEERWTAREGCLSFPGVVVRVDRPRSIVVEADSFEGKNVVLELKDWAARVVMHEMDHLDGILLIDHASKIKKGMIKRKMKKFHRRMKKNANA